MACPEQFRFKELGEASKPLLVHQEKTDASSWSGRFAPRAREELPTVVCRCAGSLVVIKHCPVEDETTPMDQICKWNAVCDRTPYLLRVELLGNPKNDLCLKTEFQSNRSLAYWRTSSRQREFFDTHFTFYLRLRMMQQTATGMAFLHKDSMPHTKLDINHVLLGPEYNVKILLAHTWIHGCFSGEESSQNDLGVTGESGQDRAMASCSSYMDGDIKCFGLLLDQILPFELNPQSCDRTPCSGVSGSEASIDGMASSGAQSAAQSPDKNPGSCLKSLSRKCRRGSASHKSGRTLTFEAIQKRLYSFLSKSTMDGTQLYSLPALEFPKIQQLSPTAAVCMPQETVTLSCQASGYPKPVVQWFEKERAVGSQVPQIAVGYCGSGQWRHFHCKVTNVLGSVVSQQISVEDAVPLSCSAASNSVILKDGCSVRVACQATGCSPFEYKWFFGQQQIEGFGCDTSEYVAREPGVYKCQVTDSKDQTELIEIEVKLYQPIQILYLTNDDYILCRPNQAQLHCKATGCPPPHYEWRLQSPGMNSYCVINGATGPDILVDQPGKYQCRVYHSYESQDVRSKAIVVEYSPPPAIPKIKKEPCEEGVQLLLTTEHLSGVSAADFVDWEWYCDSTHAGSGTSLVVTESGNYRCSGIVRAGIYTGRQVQVDPVKVKFDANYSKKQRLIQRFKANLRRNQHQLFVSVLVKVLLDISDDTISDDDVEESDKQPLFDLQRVEKLDDTWEGSDAFLDMLAKHPPQCKAYDKLRLALKSEALAEYSQYLPEIDFSEMELDNARWAKEQECLKKFAEGLAKQDAWVVYISPDVLCKDLHKMGLLSEEEMDCVFDSTGEHKKQQYLMKLLIEKPANANTFRLFEEALKKRSRGNSRVHKAWKLLGGVSESFNLPV